MALKIWLDGKLVDEADAKVSVFDHGLLYGDGVFEGIRVYDGRVFELEAHLRRLYKSAKMVKTAKKGSLPQRCKFLSRRELLKSGRQDLNLRPRDPQSRALAKLRHAPYKRQYSNIKTVRKPNFFNYLRCIFFWKKRAFWRLSRAALKPGLIRSASLKCFMASSNLRCRASATPKL